MSTQDKIDNIILNENAYFFKKEKSGFISQALIKKTFKEASVEKDGKFLLKEVKTRYSIDDNTDIYYSIAVLKYNKKPTFIEGIIEGWEEIKLAYICIVDFVDYLVIAKRNISGISSFINTFSPIDYNVLTSIFTNDDTSFEKLSMNNMNISDNSIRQKSVESLDLKENLSALGLQSYILNTARVNNGDNKTSITFNSSRINKFGAKNNLNYFVNWSNNIVNKIINYQPNTSFLSSFSTPMNYSESRANLTPIAILIILSKLYEDYENNRIERCFILYREEEKEIDIIKVLNNFERLLEINVIENDGLATYKVRNNSIDDLFLSLNPKSITLSSKKLAKVHIQMSGDVIYPILQYINRINGFIVTFDDPNLVYSNRKLFKDSRLLSNIDSFLKIFIPFPELNDVISEKGSFTNESTSFELNSIFGFVEDNFLNDANYFICDDLGKEWADHIGLSEDVITFYHSKYKDSRFSASAFQEIIGQALKNLGNLSPSDNQWELKQNFWANNYNNDGAQTNITRIRKGGTSEEAIEYFKSLKTYPNLKKQVVLVINFISKADLEDRLNMLKDGEVFKERNEIIQILWFVSSLISSCYEVGAEVYIYCKE